MNSSGLKAAFCRVKLQKRAVMIALFVGTLLNCINQGPEVMDGGTLNWVKVLLTYLVPYCVSMYSAIAAAR